MDRKKLDLAAALVEEVGEVDVPPPLELSPRLAYAVRQHERSEQATATRRARVAETGGRERVVGMGKAGKSKAGVRGKGGRRAGKRKGGGRKAEEEAVRKEMERVAARAIRTAPSRHRGRPSHTLGIAEVMEGARNRGVAMQSKSPRFSERGAVLGFAGARGWRARAFQATSGTEGADVVYDVTGKGPVADMGVELARESKGVVSWDRSHSPRFEKPKPPVGREVLVGGEDLLRSIGATTAGKGIDKIARYTPTPSHSTTPTPQHPHTQQPSPPPSRPGTATMASTVPRFRKERVIDEREMYSWVDRPDRTRAPAITIRPPSAYSPTSSSSPRPRTHPDPPSDLNLDERGGRQRSLAVALQQSPRSYATAFRSTSPRFPEPRLPEGRESVVVGGDAASASTRIPFEPPPLLQQRVVDGGGIALRSPLPRFPKTKKGEGAERVLHGDVGGLSIEAKFGERKRATSAVLRSRQPRFPPQKRVGDGADVSYDTTRGESFTKPTPHGASLRAAAFSTGSRFERRAVHGTPATLDTTFDIHTAAKEWTKRPTPVAALSRTTRLPGPSHREKEAHKRWRFYDVHESGVKSDLGVTAKRARARPTPSLRDKRERFPPPPKRPPAQVERSYDPRITQNGAPNAVSVHRPTKLSPTMAQRTRRFPPPTLPVGAHLEYPKSQEWGTITQWVSGGTQRI